MNIRTQHKTNNKNSSLGLIPEDWEVTTVAEAFEICNNFRFPISEIERKKIKGIYPYYGPTKIQDHINEYRLDGKYALIGEDGDHFLKWKDLPMTLLVNGKFNVNNHAHIIKGKENLTEWFFYYFNSKELTPHLTRQGAGRYKLTKKALGEMICPIPSFSEQIAITDCFSTWDKAIVTQNQIIAQKELRKKALMQQLLSGKKRLKGFSGEWKEVKISEIGLISTGNTPSMLITEYYGNSYCWATAYDFTSVYISDTKIKLSDAGAKVARIVPKGSVLITCIASIGKNAIANTDMAFNQQINSITPNQNFNSEFIYYKIESSNHKLIEVAGAGAVPIINKTSFSNIKLSFPSIEEQIAIANILQCADEEIQILKKKLQQFKGQKKGLMQVLLTGKKRLNY